MGRGAEDRGRADAGHPDRRQARVPAGEGGSRRRTQEGGGHALELEFKTILPLLYAKADPYSHPVIGQEGHVRGATAEVIRRYYDLWYHPNNASLVVVGGFEPAAALKTITELFGPISRADLPARRPTPTAGPRATPVRAEFPSKFEVARLVAGFNTVPADHPDEAALDLLDDILANGKTSRLFKRMVEKDRMASGVSASSNGGRYPGWFGVQVELLQARTGRPPRRRCTRSWPGWRPSR